MRVFLLLSLFLFGLSCTKKSEVEFDGLDTGAKAVVTDISIASDQLVLSGKDLDGVTSVRVTGPSGFDETFAIESKSDLSLVANGLQNISFVVGQIFSVIISDAQGASTYQINFTLQNNAVVTTMISDGAVTAAKLNDMGANDGDVLVYNNVTSVWEPRPLSSLNFVGSWDANANSPALANGGANTGPVAGDYYVVGTAGATTIDGQSGWLSGDWIIFNGTTWDKVVNSSTITSFNGRQGAVTPAAGDYDVSDLGDVDLTGLVANKILKYDGTNWVVADDDNSGGAGSVTTTEILDGTIGNDDLAGSIDQTKITNLTNDLASKLDLDGGDTMAGDIDMGGNNIINVTNVDGVDVSALKTQSDTNVTNISTNTSNISTNATGISNNVTAIAGKEDAITAGTTAQYWRGDKNWATLDNSAVGLGNVDDVQQMPLSYLDTDTSLTADSDTKVASQKAIKAYVDGAVAGAGGDFESDGTVAMSGDLDLGGNSLTNGYISLTGSLNQALTGTVSVSAASNAVTGSGTSFDTELSVGDAIEIASEIFTVSAIGSATSLTLDSNHVAGATNVAATKDKTILSLNSGDSSNLFTVLSSGNVGIGTSTPANKLTVVGGTADGIAIKAASSDPNDFYIGLSSGAPLINGITPSNGTANFKLDGRVNTPSFLARNSSGRLGIGLSAPVYKAEIQTSYGSGYFGITNASSGDVLSIDASGNVGINKAVPTEKLDVAGTVKATAFEGDGSALTNISGSVTD